ncbi:hypothetical protein QP731_16085 [Sphingomonas sp. UMB7805-LC452B]|nr:MULTISPECIES: hypothetical protein [Sphingomonas]MDK8217251.1 hypothetical protein [Sphingomonas sp. UMB7805-LC452B]
MLAGQDAIDAAVEEFAATDPVSQGVEMLSDRARAHRRAVEADSRQIIDQPNDGGFFLHDEEFAAFLASLDNHGACLVAERHRPAVEVSRLRISASITPREDGCVEGILFIDGAEHAAHEPAVGIVAKFFGQRNQANASLFEPVLAVDLSPQPPGKA